MKPLYKGMLATFFGVLFGSLVALAVQQVWMLGAILGGIASAGVSAYILFDAKAVLVAIPRAWRKAIHWRPSELSIDLLKFVGLFLLFGFASALSWLPVGLLFDDVNVDFTGLLLLSLAMTFVAILACISKIAQMKEYIWKRNMDGIIWRDAMWLFVWLSPLTALAIFRSMPGVFRWIFQKALPAIGRFAKELFILIHCRDRAMCLVDASLGMVAAFLIQQQFMGGGPLLSVGSILVGGVAGTVMFFFNREVVAIRWLKVQPNGVHV